ncbi:NAD(P)/FAD-dependent oxidoreductase [Corallococcus terminator]|uniref:NAD(P)/FAD-dependent oxidoreductase n=1 Tax=Corallococcus terminator TaxID=2316733 RepID=A0A3A8IYU6_9BACT|nr:tryptophan 7-halogenase [Corallococcus terminator]RKG87858.1 NAD(P)/FAD-dependent oxidoreductase [Corallococcus terminator]
MLPADVVIVGAGPAGATAALNLAPFQRVLLVDRRPEPTDRIGESLAPAARRLLSDMGLWTDFLADGHSPCHVSRSRWGTQTPTEQDALANLDGPGWHLDRRRFEERLRRTAVARGAALLTPASPVGLERAGDGWCLRLEHGGRVLDVATRWIIDAGGRTSGLLKPFGANRQARDRLICGWLHGARTEGSTGGAMTYTESAPDGWWYTAPLPGGRRVLAWHTDADLPAAEALRTASGLLGHAARSPTLGEQLSDTRFDATVAPGVITAHGSVLASPVGEGWLAVGDAALSFDPLSSQGLFNALFTGLAAAEATDRALRGDPTATRDYAGTLRDIDAAYRRNLAAWYALECRWPEQEFWRRRAYRPAP